MEQTLRLNDTDARYVSLENTATRHGGDIKTLPYVIRVLLENVQRNQLQGRAIDDSEIAALVDWQNHISAQLSLYVERVILPDSSGLPVLQDLAALRDAVRAGGGDASLVNTLVPVDLIVDHSLQVDAWGHPDAVRQNLDIEFEQNAERYRFLKWSQQAFKGLNVFPPGTGIIHQVNLEKIATVVSVGTQNGVTWARPDFVIGGDSHTPMVNGLGVLGWGVGGIDAEAALLGHAYSFPVPDVVGVELTGDLRGRSITTTDAALLITQRLRAEKVSGCAIEFFGDAIAQLPIADRATIANMSPEYGATCGYFPVDDNTLAYLRLTGRSESHVAWVKAYCQQNNLWFDAEGARAIKYSRVIQIDLNDAEPAMAGPRRPQDRLPLGAIANDFRDRLHTSPSEGGFGVPDTPPAQTKTGMQHGSVVVAAITSCTNTSNPSVMITAGLIARAARQRGITPPDWVKRSLSPGSRTVTDYLQAAGLMDDMETMGFHVIGYGCATCGGKSGPLAPEVVDDITQNELLVCAVLSGNRNFEGRIHKLARANYIGSPALVMAYALAGRIDIDFQTDPIATDTDGKPVWLHELWPDADTIQKIMADVLTPSRFQESWSKDAAGAAQWQALEAGSGLHWDWDLDSTYMVEPPFFKTPAPTAQEFEQQLQGNRVLAMFDDSLTTDHISPSGEIPVETPSGQYLLELGVKPEDFNSYVTRRSNFEVMTRATFANIRIRNLLTPEIEGGYTRHFPDDDVMTIFDASQKYMASGTGTIVLAGAEYGTGSSRDWAAKGTALLGVHAVIAKSFERIHRANLVGMGVVPFAFLPGEGWRELGLDGTETFSFENVMASIQEGKNVNVVATRTDGSQLSFSVAPQVLTSAERELMQQGGILSSVLSDYIPALAA